MTDEDALRAEVAERRLAQARADARALAQHNDKLNVTLREARDQLLALREQVAALALPPQQFGIVVGLPEAGLADVHVGGRLVRAAVAVEVVAVERLGVGAGVLVNEALVVVAVTDHRPAGEVVRVRERLDATSALVAGANDEEVVVQLGAALRDAEITPGESLLADRRALVAWASVARTDVEELTLERALELLADRRAKGPTKKKATRKKAAAKKASSRKSPAKKAARKKAPAKKSPAPGG